MFFAEVTFVLLVPCKDPKVTYILLFLDLLDLNVKFNGFGKSCSITYDHQQMSEETYEETMESNGSPRPAPKLNERILSTLSKRSVAAHPWHDLEIGIFSNNR